MKRITAVIFLVLISPRTFGINLETVNIRKSTFLIFNQTTEDAPYVYADGFGSGICLGISPLLAFVPNLELYDIYYGFSDADRPLPVDESVRKAYIVNIVIDPAFVFRFRIVEKMRIDLSASPSFFFPFPINSWDDGAERYTELFSYLYGALRFFQPMVGAAFLYSFSESTCLELSTRIYFPIFHIWDGESLQFQDQMKISFSFGIQLGA